MFLWDEKSAVFLQQYVEWKITALNVYCYCRRVETESSKLLTFNQGEEIFRISKGVTEMNELTAVGLFSKKFRHLILFSIVYQIKTMRSNSVSKCDE